MGVALALMSRRVPLLTLLALPLDALVRQAVALEQPRDRTAILACWMVARLALPRLPREADTSDVDALQQRAEATRRWLVTQSLPSALSLAVSRACDVAGDRDTLQLADALDLMRDAADAMLDDGSRAELTTLAQRLRGFSPP